MRNGYYKRHINTGLYLDNIEANQNANAIQPELERIGADIEFAYMQQWILTADEPGIEEWERMLGITPDLATETLEARRQRVHRIYNMRPPYIVGWLMSWIIREYNVRISRLYWSPKIPLLELWIMTNNLPYVIEIRRQIIQLLPCNVVLHMMRQIPFPEVKFAEATTWAMTHHMAKHETIALAMPTI